MKINNIKQNINLKLTNNRPVASKELAQFMFKIDFLTARKKLVDGKIDRKYFEQARYLLNQFADFGYDWEIHMAYRWALQPDDIDKMFDEVDLVA